MIPATWDTGKPWQPFLLWPRKGNYALDWLIPKCFHKEHDGNMRNMMGTWGTWLKARHRYHWLIWSINVLSWGITSIHQHYLCVSLLPVAQSCLEGDRPVPPALCLVLVDLFLASNLRMLRRWCCWVAKTAEKGQKSIKIDGFPTSQKSGKSSFLLQKWAKWR